MEMLITAQNGGIWEYEAHNLSSATARLITIPNTVSPSASDLRLDHTARSAIAAVARFPLWHGSAPRTLPAHCCTLPAPTLDSVSGCWRAPRYLPGVARKRPQPWMRSSPQSLRPQPTPCCAR
jgi:hypothetical protein